MEDNLKPASRGLARLSFSSKNFGGFTLIEIIVVVAITALLSSILIVYSQRSREQILLNVEKAKVAQTILRTKSLALAGFTKPPTNPPPCSYGFHINYTTRVYSLFEYRPPPPATCDDILAITDIDDSDPAYYFEIASTTLDRSLDFDANLVDPLGYIIFVPPDPRVLVFDKNKILFTGPTNIYLKTKDGSLTTKITVNHLTGQLSF